MTNICCATKQGTHERMCATEKQSADLIFTNINLAEYKRLRLVMEDAIKDKEMIDRYLAWRQEALVLDTNLECLDCKVSIN